MARRRPSTTSVASVSSLVSASFEEPLSPIIPARNRPPSRNVSLSKLPNDNPNTNIDPDELFAKYTVSEVKFVQNRLRADADAKQEELRLMVGERYRDLLQASASIISISRSSKRVTEALEEIKSTILSQKEPPIPTRASSHGNEDTHLRALQLLSAHMKLLLDAPEHLWRLIERKKYFPAAWLFLLARVVHRALITDEAQDEEAWSTYGIDVLEQFPLVQRQWEAVSQFRSQIIHKATLSLREYTASVEDTCAILLTLHLLDSRPLTETLSVLLTQRSKTLQTLLSWSLESSGSETPLSATGSRKTNGRPPEASDLGKPKEGFHRNLVREVKQATQAALDAIYQTVETARQIFKDDTSRLSLIRSVLEHIQSDSPDQSTSPTVLPAELQLSTESLLTTLPSSTHFLLLPRNLRMYKPYVDLSSSSSSLPQSQFNERLNEWFNNSTSRLQVAVERWFSDLRSVREVWNIRSSIWKWINISSNLAEAEVSHVESIFNEVCQRRAVSIWKIALTDGEKAFRNRLDSALSSIQKGSNIPQTDTSPVGLLFQSPPLPVSQGIGNMATDLSFKKYKAALRRQLVGRTSLLDEVLGTLESCAKTLQHDFSHITAQEQSRAQSSLVEQLSETYAPDAKALCSSIVHDLDSAIDNDVDSSDTDIDSIVFVGRVADELASSSSFISSIGCGESAAEDFRKKTSALHDRIIDRWRRYTVVRIVRDHFPSRPKSDYPAVSSLPSMPSSGLTQCLLALSNSIQRLGVSRSISRQETNVDKTLRLFITTLLNDSADSWEQCGQQALYDLTFLQKISSLRGAEWTDIFELLSEKIANLRTKIAQPDDSDDFERSTASYLLRTQLLFATLLPNATHTSPESSDKLATLLPYGIPTLTQKFHSPVEVAKPSSRFGLLLVGEGRYNI